MKKTVMFAMVLQYKFMVLSQSLFSNGGFENYYSCPNSSDMSAWAIGVVGKTDSPDFYNCSFFPNEAFSGIGSMYLGAVKYTSSVTREGIIMAMNQNMEIGGNYLLSIYSKYGYKYPNTGFNPNVLNGCYKLGVKFLTTSSIPSYPITYDYIFDPEATMGNSNNPTYHLYQCNFTPSQAFTHLFIQTIPTSKCLSNASECLMTVFYNTIDNVSLTKVTPLAVTLKAFDLAYTKDKVLFYWQTNTEMDNDFFTLFQSSDGVNWNFIQNISSKGNSNEMQSYEYENTTKLNGLHYFRLFQTDRDGTTTFLDEQSLLIKTNQLEIFPNPSHDIIYINWAQQNQSVRGISLKDNSGKLVFVQEVSDTDMKQSLSISHIEKGVYQLQVLFENGEEVVTKVIID